MNSENFSSVIDHLVPAPAPVPINIGGKTPLAFTGEESGPKLDNL